MTGTAAGAPGSGGPGSADPGSGGGARAWHAELAWLGDAGVRRDVLIEAAGDRFSRVTPDVPAAAVPAGTVTLAGLALPGLANGHSHAFHRALRGITQAGRGTFWTWRERMYEVAARLDPASYLELATAVYAEMALAGITCVGEFHYLHHGPGGVPYADPNEMGHALIAAAGRAGLRICLLDTCYLSGGLGPDGAELPLAGPQLRFADADADAWAERADALSASVREIAGHGAGGFSPDRAAPPGPAVQPGSAAPAGAAVQPGRFARAGAAIHSVRAVPRGQLEPVVDWAARHHAPLHLHLSEQVAENQACQAAYGATPAAVLADAGALGPRTTAVHATHLTAGDLDLIGGSQCAACFCPTTEADLADGIGPASALAAVGSPLTVGSDSQAVIDLFEEARRIEHGERLVTQERGHFTAARLAVAATAAGHASLGWPDAGTIAPGAIADLVTVALDTPRTAGAAPATALEAVIFGASAADVRDVVAGGRDIVRGGRHLLVPDVPAALSAAIRAVLA
ncbi:MAG TPA: formimidoylglutamate deiminase [Streptosporangiaceae bacterium]|nr:formimidoylglutamate deiminase [Streptosporangiaceae bacterium]